MNSIPVVHIQWIDATSIDSWQDIDELTGDNSIIHSIGLLIKELESTYVLALNYDSTNEHCSCIMYIPRAYVQSVKKLWTLKLQKKN